MKCWLEMNTRLFVILRALSHGYETGDFERVFPYLAEDCILESQWVLTPNEGIDAVTHYLKGKGATLKRTKSFPKCSINELVGNITTVPNAAVTTDWKNYEKASVSLIHTPGKFCLLMTQELEKEKVNVLIDVKLNDEGYVKRIDLCDPNLFSYRYFETYVRLNPGDTVAEEDDNVALVNEEYYHELYAFLSIAGAEFDEYGEVEIPMDKWVEALRCWDIFNAADSFDDVFEEIAGVSYADGWNIKNQDAADELSHHGKWMWKNRDMGRILVKRLIEWTNLYRNDFDCIVSDGW